jgi:hypothetical protein
MNMDYLAALNDLAHRFTAQALPASSPLDTILRLTPPAALTGPNGLALNETVQQVADVEVPIKVDLALLGKWVRGTNADFPADPSTEDAIGGMPVVEQVLVGTGLSTTLPPSTQMFSDTNYSDTPGVPELLGRIKGAVSQTVQRLSEVIERHPVTVSVRVRVLDESTPGVSTPATATHRLGTTGAFTPLPDPLELPAAPKAPDVTLRFPVAFTELTTGTPDMRTVKVLLSVKLTMTPAAGGSATNSDWVDLPPLTLIVPTIPIPTILVLCEHRDFGGRKLVLVPSNSTIGMANGPTIGSALSIANAALAAMSPTTGLAGFLAATPGSPAHPAASAVMSLASSPGQTIVAAHSRVDDLSYPEYVFDPGGLFGIGRFTGDNMVSSVIAIGRTGTVFDMFQDPNLNELITRFQITIDGACVCAIRKLDTTTPGSDVVFGGSVTSASPNHWNEDRITSVGFAGPTARFT